MTFIVIDQSKPNSAHAGVGSSHTTATIIYNQQYFNNKRQFFICLCTSCSVITITQIILGQHFPSYCMSMGFRAQHSQKLQLSPSQQWYSLVTSIVASRNFLTHLECISKVSTQFIAPWPMWPCLPTINYLSLRPQ